MQSLCSCRVQRHGIYQNAERYLSVPSIKPSASYDSTTQIQGTLVEVTRTIYLLTIQLSTFRSI